MTLPNGEMDKEVKPVKAARPGDDVKENFPCACKKGGHCFREGHPEGMPCEMSVTLSKSNRHKVCNQCRKNKVKKAPSNINQSVAPSIQNVPVGEVSLHMPPMPDSIPAPVPTLQSHHNAQNLLPNPLGLQSAQLAHSQQSLLSQSMSMNSMTMQPMNTPAMQGTTMQGLQPVAPPQAMQPPRSIQPPTTMQGMPPNPHMDMQGVGVQSIPMQHPQLTHQLVNPSQAIPTDSLSMLNVLPPMTQPMQPPNPQGVGPIVGLGVGQPQSGKMACQCDKGGGCSRQKHFQDSPCDRFVTITKNDKHTRCKGCRYLKKRKTGTNMQSVMSGVNVTSAMGVGVSVDVPVPSAAPPSLIPMGAAIPQMMGADMVAPTL